jgi:hypothetical protein
MDLFIRVLMVLFGWSQFEAANWALVPTLIYWKIGFVVVIPLLLLFVKFTHHERIKTNNRCCFYLSPTCICNGISIGLGKDELNLVKILSAILIFVGVYLVTSSPKH